jgi:L,D-transpeptidase ErfK/SrfK
VSKGKLTLDQLIFASRHVENRLPNGSNWDGKDELLVTAEEFQAAKTGAILPKQSAPAKKAAATSAKRTTSTTTTPPTASGPSGTR